MDAIVLAHGGTAGGIAEVGLVLVPLAIMGVLSILRKRRAKAPKARNNATTYQPRDNDEN